MPDPLSTSPPHATGSQMQKSAFKKNSHNKYLTPALNILAMVLLLVLANFSHASLLAPAFGASGVIILLASKISKFKPGVILSTISLFAMAMTNIFHWADTNLVAVLSGKITSGNTMFTGMLTEGIILAIMILLYVKLINSTHLSISQKWFDKKSFSLTFMLLFYFQLFLVFFCITAYAMQALHPLTRLTMLLSNIIAAGVALLAVSIPAIIYFSKGSGNRIKRNRHKHHHGHRETTPDR